MNAQKLRQILLRKPFRAVKITLDAGDPVEIRHPEGVLITDEWVVIVPGGIDILIFEPERVVSIARLRNGSRARK